jgi:hypothetical protein
MKTQKYIEKRDKDVKETVEDLQDKLQKKEERLKHHKEEERRIFKDKIHNMNKQIQKVDDTISN